MNTKENSFHKANSYFNVGDLVKYIIIAPNTKFVGENNVGIIIYKKKVHFVPRALKHRLQKRDTVEIEYRIKWLVKGGKLWVDESSWFEPEGCSTLEASLVKL